MTADGYRLPTEAEWEYAAKGGMRSNGYTYAGSNDLNTVAWYTGNSGGVTHAVETKAPNELGLYDMAGNIWEWCQDWYGIYRVEAQENPTGASSGASRVGRGGSWDSDDQLCRSTYRNYDSSDSRDINIGFRLVRRP
jgi:formylglycine-generating enzyme required for sulfatase activity